MVYDPLNSWWGDGYDDAVKGLEPKEFDDNTIQDEYNRGYAVAIEDINDDKGIDKLLNQ